MEKLDQRAPRPGSRPALAVTAHDESGKFLPRVIPLVFHSDMIFVQDVHLLSYMLSASVFIARRLDPEEEEDGRVVEPVDVDKLRVALSHSYVIVSLFCRPHDCFEIDCDGNLELFGDGFEKGVPLLGNLMERVVPVSPSNGKLVGFGRAVSDVGLTASIHDVVVIPSLRRMGIGRMIVRRIVRMLTSRDIYDIAALCSENERLFFEACGFGGDVLNSTTMMYTKTVATPFGDNQTVKHAGRKLLLVPPLREPFASLNPFNSQS
ncbi:hypothetical protein JRO89_XS14G0084600 [Xanthoceras sorbifolium]|uniref:N-acetyltransferase domain-containing protein n=1 Tax=Xanthoceras sorbifolium TaxID=99658 RepID=A0ABQ8H4I4_9ROSI|nr:hypothetical protein JRO89_XS14G0084600 [Xanthoceras sorbifolium]